MISYILVFFLCQPGAMSGCSNGLLESRIPNLPTKEACEEALVNIKKEYYYRSGFCILQKG